MVGVMVYAGELEVRPLGAPTTGPGYRGAGVAEDRAMQQADIHGPEVIGFTASQFRIGFLLELSALSA
jgi:hypothetical protein